GDKDQDRRQRATGPGMISWADPDARTHCRLCRHYHKRHCQLFLDLMRARLGDSKFLGPKLQPGQTGCAHYHAKGDDTMVSINERFRKTGFIKASDLMDGDLTLTIESFMLDQQIGEGKWGDVLTFTDGRRLVLKETNAHQIAALLGDDSDKWPGRQ